MKNIFRMNKSIASLKKETFKMPNRLTRLAETKVAATPIKAHNPLKPPIIDGFKPETISRTPRS